MQTLNTISKFGNILSTVGIRRYGSQTIFTTRISEANKQRPRPGETTGRSIPAFDNAEQDEIERKNIIAQVNTEIQNHSHGRLFAVIHVAGKQFKVTTNDIIMVQETWPPDVGDRLRLEKVLLVGGANFTLIGRPLLPRDLVKIEGTVIEKTLSYTKLHFILKKRQNFRRLKFNKTLYSMVRINSIEFDGLVDERKDIEGMRPSHVY